MAKSPSYPFNRTLPELISDTRRPRPTAETGWYDIGPTNPQGVDWQNGWGGDPDRPPSYNLGQDGWVRHKGVMVPPSDPSLPSVAYTLPEECRPQFQEPFLIGVKGGGYANGHIEVNGDVVIESINNGFDSDAIRYNVYNDNSSPGFLDITMHDYLTLQNYGPSGTLIQDQGGGGMEILTVFGGDISIGTVNTGNISIQTTGTVGGAISILSDGTAGYIQIMGSDEVDISAQKVLELLSETRIVHIVGPNPVHPDVPNEIIVGTSPSGGITGNIYIGNEGGFLSIIEGAGTRIASGVSLLLAGHARYPLTLSAYKSHIIFESDYVEMGSLSFGSTLPTPVVGSSCILYVYEYTPGTYGLYAMLGSTRTRLASS